jgi:hypothetical protein
VSDQQQQEDEPRERDERADKSPEAPDEDVQPPVHHDETPADEPGQTEEPY